MSSKNTNYTEKFNDSQERIFSHRKRLNGDTDDFFNVFLQIFHDKSKKIAMAFIDSDLKAQQKMMKSSLLYLINVQGSRLLFSAVESIAESHSANGHNISLELYDYWLDSLMETVRAFDLKFDEDVELAWRMTLAPGIAFMKYYYDKDIAYRQPEKNASRHIDHGRPHS